jgi:ring-1,2-phenylacetyl-CoA epoxidase subunit PaaE
MAAAHAAFHPLRVAAIEPLTDDAVALTFDVPAELRGDYAWTAGQHVTIRCDDGVRRSYSVCTPPSTGLLQVGVKRLPGGYFSGAVLDALAVGDSLEVMTPAGRFTPRLDPEAAKSYVAIAAGSGITPVLSIVATLLEVEPRAEVTLLYANRSSSSVMFLDEVADLKDRHVERFRVLHVLSREQQEVELFSGRLDTERLRRLCDTLIAPKEVDEWFLCGPQAMVLELREALSQLGVDRVHTELFHADSVPREALPDSLPDRPVGDDADAAQVTIRLDGRSSTFPLAQGDVPVLEAALRVRADAPFACRGGVCGTCRARLLEGTVTMEANWALEADELARGYVLTCQSHPTSPTVVLDYDG